MAESDKVEVELNDNEPSGREEEVEIELDKLEKKDDAEKLRADRLDEELRSVRTELNSFRASLGQNRQQTQDEDPYAKREREIYARQDSLGATYAAAKQSGTASAEQITKWTKDARDLESELAEVRSERSVARLMPVLTQRQQQAVYQNEYSDVYRNDNAVRFAKAEYDKQLALGRPDTKETVDYAMNEARRQFGMVSKGQPTDTDRSQLSSSGNGGRNNVKKGSNKIVLGKAEKKMAIAAYHGHTDEKGNKIDERGAYQRWAQRVGRRVQEEKRKHPGKWSE